MCGTIQFCAEICELSTFFEMRAVVQRVSSASVAVGGTVVGEIGSGMLVFVGVGAADTDKDATTLAAKLAGARIFNDRRGKMNLSISEVGGSVLVVSQFTLYGTVQRGRRPSFSAAASPAIAEPLVEKVVTELVGHGLEVATGQFGAMMEVELVNNGPVTLGIEVRDGVVI